MTNILYNIDRWDVITQGNSIKQTPIIYIKPDIKFIEYIKANKNSVVLQISGSNTIYDGKVITGSVNRGCNVPNCRPNFFAKTGNYIITLDANWYGYPKPDSLGKVSFYNLKNNESAELRSAEGEGEGEGEERDVKSVDEGRGGFDTKHIIFIGVGLLIILILIILFSLKSFKRNNKLKK